jgi:hypothetical protein
MLPAEEQGWGWKAAVKFHEKNRGKNQEHA